MQLGALMMSNSSRLTDAYAHVGVPRFQSVEDYCAVMASASVGRAVLCSFDSCPDLARIHAAICKQPDIFRGLGVPIGTGRAEIDAAARAQLAAGFSGLRLSHLDVVERPWLLDIVAEARGIAVVCGQASTDACARILVAHLERHQDAIVVGGHFGGVDNPKALKDGVAADLFAHPRFLVVFSRHGAFPPSTIRAWAEGVLSKTGWARVMWGSEAPVLFWRNETMVEAISWVDELAPTGDERAGFFQETAARLYFAQPVKPVPLRLPFEPWDRARTFPATMWARGLPVAPSVAGRLVHGWLEAGGRGTLGSYIETVLDSVLPALPNGGSEW
jgi:predicted TIM-barrel fold metal-dependent hydrolase